MPFQETLRVMPKLLSEKVTAFVDNCRMKAMRMRRAAQKPENLRTFFI